MRRPMLLLDLLADLVDFGCNFGAHWILKGVSKSTNFEELRKTERKKGVQKRDPTKTTSFD